MLALKESGDYGLFFGKLQQASQRALLLDYDGTIAPFTTDRRRALPYPSVVELLDIIMTCTQTRVVLITGRSAHELKSLLNGGPCPEIWGTHGLERLQTDGSYEVVQPSPAQRAELDAAEDCLVQEKLTDLIEVKPGSIAVHWRGLHPAIANEARTVAYRSWSPIARRTGLMLAEFDGGMELRLSNRDKGDAVRTILEELGRRSMAAYMGDDRTDEHAFRALRAHDLAVLVRPEYRETEAALWIKPPDELLQFLVHWLAACGGELC